MKNIKFLTVLLAGILLFGIFGFKSTPIVNAVNMKEAFDQGKIQLTFEALDKGKVFQVTVLNLTLKSLSLLIPEGTTAFTDKIQITNDKQRSIEVPANGETKFKVNQKHGKEMIKKGSVTIKNEQKK
jgi:hypothetical protein